jgi:hypothetical protein
MPFPRSYGLVLSKSWIWKTLQKLVHVFSSSMTLKIFQSDVPELQPHMLEMVVETMECLESFALKMQAVRFMMGGILCLGYLKE